MSKAIILGTGGHSRVIVSMLAAIPDVEIKGIVELGEYIPGEIILGIPVLGSVQVLEGLHERGQISIYLAIGDNASRRDWFHKIKAMGFLLPNLVSGEAIFDRHAKMGAGNVVCPRAYIGPAAVLGDNNLINTAAVIEHEVRVGSHCHIAPSSTVAGRTGIGDETFIGAGATVIDRIQIADRTTIGAGAVVIKSIEQAGKTYVGVPAKCLQRE